MTKERTTSNFHLQTQETKPMVVIVGETASGKSALAMDLAVRFKGEIICADSWTVYKGFDIGTAKPSIEDQRLIPHHILDVADPDKGFSAAIFQRMTVDAINDITSRGKLPIMVGGTGLYIDSVIYNYSFLPPGSTEVRNELNGLTLEQLIGIADERGLDTSSIDVRNKRRVIRLIENNGLMPSRDKLRDKTIIIGMQRDQKELKERIAKRIDEMILSGFVQEVETLGIKYGWDVEPMKAPGYRAFGSYIRGEISLESAKELFRQNDLKLAKKQRTWFKRNNSIQWVSDPRDSVELVTTFLNTIQ